MIRMISTDANSFLQEQDTGIFVSTDVSWVRDYKYGGPSKIEKLPVIRIDPDAPRQEVLGFGGAFTDASCYLISLLDEAARRDLIEDLFSPSRMGFGVGRLTVAQCDFGRAVYSYCDTPGDVGMEHFSIDYDREYILPTVRAARECNLDLFLLSSPWSPPGWMKTGGLMTGGWMRQGYLPAFANYYLRYLQEYAKAGVKIDALTAQNESETDQLSLMPACYWHPEFEMYFLRDFLSPALKENGLGGTELWIMDHNYVMWRRARWMLDDPSFKPFVKGIAWHPYEGPAEAMSWLHERHPDVDAHMTELGAAWKNDPDAVCADGRTFISIMRNWSRSLFCWNIVLDETGKPHIGPFIHTGEGEGGGMVQINSKTHEVKYGPQYKALAHFSKYVKRGARCIDSQCDVDRVSCVAFRNPDGGYAVVVSNAGDAANLSLVVKDRYAQAALPARSLCTLVFR